MPPIPEWILAEMAPWFRGLAASCLSCAWLALGVIAAGAFAVLWMWARGPDLAQRQRQPRIATPARAFTGLVWILTVVILSWLSGLRGLVPLVGDAVFIALAGTVCLEWYSWWTLPPWVGKLTELVVIGLLWWVAWLVGQTLPAVAYWPVTVIGIGASALILLARVRDDLGRRLARAGLVALGLTLLLLPAELRPELRFLWVWITLGVTFSWLAVELGGLWLKLPQVVADIVAPVWLVTMAVLQRLGVKFIAD